MSLINRLIISTLAILFMVTTSSAEQATIAVASNFMKPMGEIADAFMASHDHELKVSYGSSGRLFAQISNGAPFDLFLSADELLPQRLFDTGKSIAPPQIYAIGQLALWSNLNDFEVSDTSVLTDNRVKRIALANPRLAPYGAAAQQVLESFVEFEAIENKLVQGESIAQAYQFVYSRNAQLGFVGFSQVIASNAPASSYWLVPRHYYEPISQGVVLLKRAENNAAATEFYEYLLSEKVGALLAKSGYLPQKKSDGFLLQ